MVTVLQEVVWDITDEFFGIIAQLQVELLFAEAQLAAILSK